MIFYIITDSLLYLVDWLQDNTIDAKTIGAIYNAAQPLYKANKHLKQGIFISTWSRKTTLILLLGKYGTFVIESESFGLEKITKSNHQSDPPESHH